MRAWKPDVGGVDEVFHARFVDHRYPPHVHSTWTLMILDNGSVKYRLGRHDRITTARTVAVLPPGVAHDGCTAKIDEAFDKRVLYLTESLLPAELVGTAVDRSLIDSSSLRRDIQRLHHLLVEPAMDLEVDEALLAVADQVIRHLRPGRRAVAPKLGDAAEALRAYLDDRLFEQQHLTTIAAHLGWDARHLVRSFTNTFGISPHQYIISRRVAIARARLLEGQTPAAVASEVGFFDQAHLHRHFRRHTGTTPARFASSNA